MSTGFTFGANNAAPTFGATNTPNFGNAATTSQFGFGSNTQQQNTSFKLGAFSKPTGSVAPQTASFGFGTPASTASTGFGFGASTSTQPAAGLGTGISFGAQAPTANVGFSLGATPASTAPASSSFGASTGGFGFGAQPAANNLSFGTPQTTATNLSFGAPQTSTAPLTFGAQTTTPNLNFGAPQTTATNLSFGTPKTTSFGASALSFGAPATTTTALSFGAPTSTGLGITPTTGFGALGAPTSVSLGAPLGGTSTGLTLGKTSTSTSTGFSLGGLTSVAASSSGFTPASTALTTSATTSGVSFGPLTATPSLSLGPTTTAQNASGSINFKSIPNTGFGVTTGITTTAPVEKVGLGGIQSSATTSSNTSIPKEVPPREQPVPNEIQQDIENFKNYIKQQKMFSSDVSRCSVKDFRSVEQQIRLLNNVIKDVEMQLEKNKNMAEKLKYDTAQGLELLEMAQRTQDTPAGLQYENTAPMHYFLKLADTFENDMQNLKTQIENTDKYVKDFGQPATLTAQDLSNGMRKLHDTFVALAGRLHSVHSQVETQKELYLNLRKQVANDYSNPFEALERQVTTSQKATVPIVNSPPKIACGPTPFNQVSNFPITSQQNVGTSGFSASTTPGGALTSTLPLFGTATGLNKSGFQNTTMGSTSFQLQKPPTGNKRGKQ